jgi:hypothetical protein
MNFTGSLIRPAFSGALAVLVIVWGLGLWTFGGGPTLSIAAGENVRPEKASALIAHRPALRQLGKKLVAPKSPAMQPQRWANNP